MGSTLRERFYDAIDEHFDAGDGTRAALLVLANDGPLDAGTHILWAAMRHVEYLWGYKSNVEKWEASR